MSQWVGIFFSSRLVNMFSISVSLTTFVNTSLISDSCVCTLSLKETSSHSSSDSFDVFAFFDFFLLFGFFLSVLSTLSVLTLSFLLLS